MKASPDALMSVSVRAVELELGSVHAYDESERDLQVRWATSWQPGSVCRSIGI